MPQETVGFVKLEWVCPKCKSRNPGPEKTCVSCGAPQPPDVKFELAQTQQATQDEELKKIAEAGPDIHCPFCGTRNPSTAKVCSQCGADLKEGLRREAGQVVGAYQPKEVRQVPCSNCGSLNPETALKCAQCGAPTGLAAAQPTAPATATPAARPSWLPLAIGAALVLLCIFAIVGFVMLASPKESQQGVVQGIEWQTVVNVEGLQPVNHQDWQDEIPSGAQLGDCADRVRTVQSVEPISGKYDKVCGTPYTVDTGSGVGKVVQDCQFEVYAPYCEYTVQEWQVVDRLTQSGNDFSPAWAQPQLASGERLGSRNATFAVVFETDKGQIVYPVGSLEEFEQFQMGSMWVLTFNGFGQIVSVEPAK
jgi:DNA-directed RNA polymerase subunit RPC12/RpoP